MTWRGKAFFSPYFLKAFNPRDQEFLVKHSCSNDLKEKLLFFWGELGEHTEAKIHILSKKSHFLNINFNIIHISKIHHCWQNSQFENLICQKFTSLNSLLKNSYLHIKSQVIFAPVCSCPRTLISDQEIEVCHSVGWGQQNDSTEYSLNPCFNFPEFFRCDHLRARCRYDFQLLDGVCFS